MPGSDTTPPGSAPIGVHLVGSVPLPTAADVFTKVSQALPGRLLRIPDGEPAERQMFVVFQREMVLPYPQALRTYDANMNSIVIPTPSPAELAAFTAAVFKDGPPQTHYDTHAIASYKVFSDLRSAGIVPPGTKLQVGLPSPINTLCIVADGYQATMEPIYEEALMASLKRIETTIPHSDLCIQWDLAAEFAMLEGATWPHFGPFFSPVKEGIAARALRLVDAVDPGVDVGLHLCYGDIGHQHFFEPRDMGNLVWLAKFLKTQ